MQLSMVSARMRDFVSGEGFTVPAIVCKLWRILFRAAGTQDIVFIGSAYDVASIQCSLARPIDKTTSRTGSDSSKKCASLDREKGSVNGEEFSSMKAKNESIYGASLSDETCASGITGPMEWPKKTTFALSEVSLVSGHGNRRSWQREQGRPPSHYGQQLVSE